MALQVAKNDVSILPFDELWLFSQCIVEGQSAWYALANIVGYGGDLVFGRDAFGYPSKQGSVDIGVVNSEFHVSGKRLDREFVNVSGNVSGNPIATKNTQIRVVGLKAFPKMGGHGPGARLTVQPWTVLRSDAFLVSPDSLVFTVPDTPSPGVIGKRDPWFELRPLRIESATLASGVIRIMPARYVGEVPNWEPYLLERCDGCFGPGEALLGGGNDTFIV